jgi:biotin carboxyl carrier protein
VATLTWAVTVGGRTFDLELSGGEDGIYQLALPDGGESGEEMSVGLRHVHGSKYLISLGDRSMPVFIDRWNGSYRVVLYGHEFSADVEDADLHRLRAEVAGLERGVGPAEIIAPMPGLVLSLGVVEGEGIEKGQSVVVIESMKMENEIRASVDGIVKKVLVEPGMAVDKGQTLLELIPPE